MDKPTTTVTVQVKSPVPETTAKQLYQAPMIIYRAPLEATAGTCSTYPGKAMGAPMCTITNS